MNDYLIKHAIRNVWCTPNQDNQIIVKPVRLTPFNGARGSLKVMWTSIRLPDDVSYFHIYQIGQISPILLNLFKRGVSWVTLAEACVAGENICDIYTTAGISLPRTQTWYMVTRENAVLLAVKKSVKMKYDFNTHGVYLRVYSNEFYGSERSADYGRIDVRGGVMVNTQAILDLQSSFTELGDWYGGVYAFVNGYKVSGINLTTAKVGDIAEFVLDGSIRRVIDFKITNLPTFDSTLDSKGKYLLHYEIAQLEEIEFIDDIDVFLINQNTGKGVYVHKNAVDALRMVTHRDYAIPVAYVSTYFHHFLEDDVVPIEKLYLRLHIRKSGYQRGLIREHHRIQELYLLDDTDRINAMIGTDANVPSWQAAKLESSAYTRLMSLPRKEITVGVVQDAYGYNTVASLIGDAARTVETFKRGGICAMGVLSSVDSTVFEYDWDGHLLVWSRHTNGPTYTCQNYLTQFAEAIIGEGGHALDEYCDQLQITLDPSLQYRFYQASVVGGVQQPDWVDVTGTSAYTVGSGKATWIPNLNKHTLVRSDKKFLVYQKSVMADSGVLMVTLDSVQSRNGGPPQLRNMEVPMGELDVFVNGRCAIPGLDCIVNFPDIAIVNKDFLIDPEHSLQKIVVRHTGFCNNLLEMTPASEFGFIQDVGAPSGIGRLSVNARYDLHPGRVLRVIVGGRLITDDGWTRYTTDGSGPGSINYSEGPREYWEIPNGSAGAAYLIRDLIIPMRGVVSIDTYAYRERSVVVDKTVSDYLTLKIPQGPREPTIPNPITARIRLYSPFICNIIYSLVDNTFDSAILAGHYDDVKVRELCAPFEYLLNFDPVHVDHRHNPDYVEVHPHLLDTEINLDLPRYRFIYRVVALYANGLVNLSSFIKLV